MSRPNRHIALIPVLLLLTSGFALAGAFEAAPAPDPALPTPVACADAFRGHDGTSAVRAEAAVADAFRAQQDRNRAYAACFLDILAAGEADDATRAVAAAKAGARWQAATLGLEWTDPVSLAGHDAPSAAVRALAARHDVTLGAEDAARVDALDALPAPVPEALARFVDAFLALDEATRLAFADTDTDALADLADSRILPGAEPSPNRALAAAGVDVTPVLPTRNQFLDALLDLRSALAAVDPAVLANAAPVDLPPAVAIDLDAVGNHYTADYALVVDAGGDDAYHNNAGGSSLADGRCGLLNPEVYASAALVDFGGQDTFGDADAPRSCGANGGGRLGTGFLYSESGDDAYHGARWGVNGGADVGGVGFLLDAGGSDTYTSTSDGVNGGGSRGVGFLLDVDGSDVYETTGWGANGGAVIGTGLLLDGGGNDVHLATDEGVNGGAALAGAGYLLNAAGDDAYEAGDFGMNGGGNFGVGFLLDGDGRDTYQDRIIKECVDCSRVPKGFAGAHVDLSPTPPGETHEPEWSPSEGYEPHVIVAVPDSGINPYHEQFRRPDRTEHPCTYIEDFPCDVERLDLTLDAPDFETAFEADKEVWENVEQGKWYWIPGTVFVAVYCEEPFRPTLGPASPYCILDTDGHGTGTTSSVISENPDALIAASEGSGNIAHFRSGNIPVDVYSVSWGNVVPVPGHREIACQGLQEAPLYVTSAGNDPRSTLIDCAKASPHIITVGGAYAQSWSEEVFAAKQPEVVSYYCRPTAVPDSIDGTRGSFCGTSFSAPTVAGALSKVILGLREESGYTGSVLEGYVDPVLGITVDELRGAMNRTASYNPDAQYPNTSLFTSVPRNPVAPWIQWGWGFYDGPIADATLDHLLGVKEAPEKPFAARAYMQAQYEGKQTVHGPLGVR